MDLCGFSQTRYGFATLHIPGRKPIRFMHWLVCRVTLLRFGCDLNLLFYLPPLKHDMVFPRCISRAANLTVLTACGNLHAILIRPLAALWWNEVSCIRFGMINVPDPGLKLQYSFQKPLSRTTA